MVILKKTQKLNFTVKQNILSTVFFFKYLIEMKQQEPDSNNIVLNQCQYSHVTH